MMKYLLDLAATALTLGNCNVVTMDNDLAAVPGLRVETWAQQS
jgi:predicted nucleic acid-binding protein